MTHIGILKTTVAAMAVAFAGSAAVADQVELSTSDGSMVLKGELLSFEGEVYEIKTDMGTFKFPATTVSCEGESCPKTVLDFSTDILVTDDVSKNVIDAIVTGLAAKNNMEARENSDGDALVYNFLDFDGNERGTIRVQRLDLTAATGRLVAGGAGLVVSASALPQGEIERISSSGGPDLSDGEHESIVALDAFAPIVNLENRVNALSVDDLADIASGRISNWSELGGQDAEIRLILPAEGTSEFDYIRDFLIQPYRLRLGNNIEWVDDTQSIIEAIKKDRNAITFASLTAADGLKPLPMQRFCGMLAFPSEFAIKAEEYPFTRRIRIYSNQKDHSPGVNPLLSYATSQASQATLGFSGVQGQSISMEPISRLGDRLVGALTATPNPGYLRRLQEFVDEVAFASRLSTAFRFVSGSSQLDTKALQDVELVADFIADSKRGVREILLIGFTDDVGRDDVNTELAYSRAETVRQALLKAGKGRIEPDMLRVLSYGPLAPVDCNDTLAGRSSNRRVEIWFR